MNVSTNQDVTIVIPCLNEALSIGLCVDEALAMFRQSGLSGEILVADNGSNDGSAEIAVAHGARVVHVAARGYNSAIRGGIEAANNEFVVLADADGQHDMGDVPRFVEKLRAGYELVIGNRFDGKISRGAMMWTHRYIGNPLLSGLLRLLFHTPIHDVQCGMRALTRSSYEHLDLRTTGFEGCAEMVMKGARARLVMTEIGITVRPDLRDRPPHLRTVPDGLRNLIFILMCAPNWLFIAPGLILLSIGIALVSWLTVGAQHIGSIGIESRTELFGVLIASLGFNIASIGMFARVFSFSEPLRRPGRSLGRILKSIKLEQGLGVGGVLMAIGLSGVVYEIVNWAGKGYGNLPNDRLVIFWSMWFLLGVQVCFSSIFLSMLGISRGTWIGEQ